MSSLPLPFQFSSSSSTQQKPTEPLKAIVFAIANHRLALSIDTVLKVVNYPSQIAQSLGKTELIHLGQHTITLLNLHSYLQPNYREQLRKSQFLVVAQSPEQEIYAIVIDTPPDLVLIPLELIRPLPAFYQQEHGLNIASHVAVLDQEETQPIFLLDLEQVLKVLFST